MQPDGRNSAQRKFDWYFDGNRTPPPVPLAPPPAPPPAPVIGLSIRNLLTTFQRDNMDHRIPWTQPITDDHRVQKCMSLLESLYKNTQLRVNVLKRRLAIFEDNYDGIFDLPSRISYMRSDLTYELKRIEYDTIGLDVFDPDLTDTDLAVCIRIADEIERMDSKIDTLLSSVVRKGDEVQREKVKDFGFDKFGLEYQKELEYQHSIEFYRIPIQEDQKLFEQRVMRNSPGWVSPFASWCNHHEETMRLLGIPPKIAEKIMNDKNEK